MDPTQDALEQVIVKLTRAPDGSPQAMLNGTLLNSLDELRQRLGLMSSLRTDIPVIIDPEGSIAMETVVKVYDWARETGLSRVYLATRP